MPRRLSRHGGLRDVFVCAFQSIHRHSIFTTSDINLEHFVATLKDSLGVTVGSLKRTFVAVAADEDVVR